MQNLVRRSSSTVPRRRRALIVIAATVGASFATVVPTATATPPPGFDSGIVPGRSLELRGAAAGEALEARATAAALPTIALGPGSDAGASAGTFTDPHAFLGPAGELGYSEPALPLDQRASAAPAVPDDSGTSLAPTAVLQLHSRPGSAHTVYLDLDGHTTSGTAWNDGYNGGADFTSAPYDTDGNPSTFSADELGRIVEIFLRVAEDFAPFDVDVTTEPPPLDDLRRSGAADDRFGVRVVVTSSDWYYDAAGARTGGVAYVGSMRWSSDTPAFVFAGNLAGGAARPTGEATAHEVGHTLGLYHDGTTTGDAYYAGHGSWAPIMGVGYYRPLTQWSRGEYPNANNTQDDLAIMTARVGTRADDHGDTAATATNVTLPASTLGVIGVDDADVVAFDAPAGVVRAELTTATPYGNLYATVDVRDADGDVVAVGSPDQPTGWTAALAADVPAGTYTAHVRRIGLDGVDGFSDYASAGAWRLTITTSANVAPSATITGGPTTGAAPLAVRLDGSSSTDPDGAQLSYRWDVDGRPSSDTATLDVTVGAGTHIVVLTVTDSDGATATATTTVTARTPDSEPPTTTSQVAEPPGDGVTTMTPQRLLDTRSGLGGSRRLSAGGTFELAVSGGSVPDAATAVVLTVAAVNPAGAGFLTVFPCSDDLPAVSTLNYGPGGVVANTTVATLSSRGTVCVHTSAATDVIADAAGWISPGGTSRLTPVGPIRAVDTRSGLGSGGRLGAGTSLVADLTGYVSPGATAAAVNITAVRADTAGFITAWPCGQARPEASILNYGPGRVTPNNAIVGLGRGERLCIYTSADIDLLVDVTGEFAGSGLGYLPAEPQRLADTRDGGGRPAAGTTHPFVPPPAASATVVAASVNVTGAGFRSAAFLTSYDCRVRPDASTVNPRPGTAVANGAIVGLDDAGRGCVYTSGEGHVIVDLLGWWVG